MKVAVGLLFERNAQDIELQLAALSGVADNGTTTCDEKNLHFCGSLHGVSTC